MPARQPVESGTSAQDGEEGAAAEAAAPGETDGEIGTEAENSSPSSISQQSQQQAALLPPVSGVPGSDVFQSIQSWLGPKDSPKSKFGQRVTQVGAIKRRHGALAEFAKKKYALPGTVQGQRGLYKVFDPTDQEFIVAEFDTMVKDPRSGEETWTMIGGPWMRNEAAEIERLQLARVAEREEKSRTERERAWQRRRDELAAEEERERVRREEREYKEMLKRLPRQPTKYALAGTVPGESGYYEVWSGGSDGTEGEGNRLLESSHTPPR